MSLDSYLNGDDSAFDSAVLESMPIVEQTVNFFLSKAPGMSHLEDDLIAQGYLSLVKTLPKMRRSRAKANRRNNAAYIRRAVKSAILSYVRQETDFNMSPMTWRRKTKKGEKLPTMENTVNEVGSYNPAPANELLQTIFDCCHSADERIAVDMRRKGYTYKEIAEHLNVSTGQVHAYLDAVYKRLENHA